MTGPSSPGRAGPPGATLAVPTPPSIPTAHEAATTTAPRHDRVPPGLRFAVATLVAGAAFWVVYAAFVLTEAGQRLENEALLGAALRGPTDLGVSLEGLSQISVVSFAIAIVLVFLAAVLRGRFALGVVAAAVMAGSVVAAEVLKAVLGRPELVTGPAWILRNSFPSGHAAVAAAIGIGVLIVSPDRLRWLVLPVGAIAAAAIGQATQVTGWHRMSCAIGGALLVVATASAGLAFLARAGLVTATGHGRIDGRVRGLLVAGGVGAVVLGLAVTTLSIAFPLLRAPEGATRAFLHTTLALVGFGITVLLFAAFAELIAPYTLGRRSPAVQATAPPALPTDGPDLTAAGSAADRRS